MTIAPETNRGVMTRYHGNNSKHGIKTVNNTANGLKREKPTRCNN
jgi:hypothetical protein